MRISAEHVYYVALTSLNLPNSEQGKRSWEIVRSLTCANSGKAWIAYWKAGTVPSTAACATTPAEAFGFYNEITQIFKSVGAAAGYVPQLTREDGILIAKNEWQKLGRGELPAFTSPLDDKSEMRWLAAPAPAK